MADKQSPRRALLEKAVNGYEVISDADRQACQAFNEEYKRFIDAAKTERETVDYAVAAAQAAGFRPVTLGESRLRTETAALMAVAYTHLKKTL